MKVVPSTEMRKMRISVGGGGQGVQVEGLDLLDVRCPEPPRGKDQEAVGHNSGS